ncbi:Serine/threonine-protein kinase PCRK2 [Camellia lanceoleosa]|uniref:Serine/threonine-protein kinase PCRK2 n=1 Tax=Camellia lanceoleosa TaxID=1840588 RepID=A0ACC0IJ51_9ERIC|nr:Serine/threonine-protein kinase PCRK2 [Camellia lanceoleosa]
MSLALCTYSTSKNKPLLDEHLQVYEGLCNAKKAYLRMDRKFMLIGLSLRQLSDFGLAIWGPSDSSFLTDNDIVGTFGYLAPEYFMYGKVSDKVDVYSFGVVLFELLSGRKVITFNADKGQESLVIWAKLKLVTGNLRSILNLNLEGNIDETQNQRMGLAARLCLTRSAQLRPKMSQRDVDEWLNMWFRDQNEAENQDNTNDEVYPHLKAESHLGLALLDVEDTTPSFNSMEQSSKMSLEEYLKERLSQSSSLDWIFRRR